MVFDNIFQTAQGASQSGVAAQGHVAGYLLTTPAETVTVPPHDPARPFTPGPQDPKIVRETAPAAQAVFDLIGALTQTLGQSAAQQSTIFNDPATTVDTASPIMSQGDQITRMYPDTTPTPSTPTPPAS